MEKEGIVSLTSGQCCQSQRWPGDGGGCLLESQRAGGGGAGTGVCWGKKEIRWHYLQSVTLFAKQAP